jgi:hypothetical protein
MLYTNKPKDYDQFVAAMRSADHMTAGKRFGSLVSIAHKRPGRRSAIWTWECDCGEQIVLATQYVLGDGARDCGCGRHLAGRYEGVAVSDVLLLHRSIKVAHRQGTAAAVWAIISATRKA